MTESNEITEQQAGVAGQEVANGNPDTSRHHHKKPQSEHNVLFKVRQILNLLFMLLGVVGAVMYSGLVGNGTIEQMGGIIVVIAISMKMAECVLRYIK